jgi:hypothetical protein
MSFKLLADRTRLLFVCWLLEEIANISGLSLDEVKKLKAERTV